MQEDINLSSNIMFRPLHGLETIVAVVILFL